MRVPWTRLIRFESSDGRILRGEPILPSEDFDVGKLKASDKLTAKVVTGADIYDTSGSTKVTDEIVQVKRILGPIEQKDVPIIRCIGLNYAKHIKEAGRQPPPFPSIFFKPNTCVIGHDENIVVPKIAQDDQADYEGELCVIIGKDAKNVSKEDALDYVAAYCCGNDVSSRKLQRNAEFAGKVPQWGFSKGFDTFAPLGPVLVSSQIVGDAKDLWLRTILDGKEVQSESVSDLLFDCATLIAHQSQGTTLQKGTVIMTGTPGGVGSSLNPPKYLTPGTVVEVSISKLGTLRNGVEFA